MKLKYYLLHIVVLLCSFEYGFPENLSDRDTVIKSFPEISIEADRYILSGERDFVPYSVITQDDIKNINPLQVSDLLVRETSLFIRDYGGMGGVKTISLRGTSSQQTLVMLEGMRLNSIQSNSLDLSTIPVSLLRSIEIIRGGNSAISGGSSLGGTVNFNLNDVNDNKFIAGIGYGSFNEMNGHTSLSTRLSHNASIGAGIDYSRSDGNYPFAVNNYGETKTLHRDNAAFENIGLLINSVFRTGEWQNKIIALGRMSERGSPGPVLLGYVSGDNARLYEKDADVILSTNRLFGDNYFSAAAMYRHNAQRYYDPSSIEAMRGDTNSKFFTNELQFKSTYDLNLSELKFEFSLDGAHSSLNGDLLQPEVGRHVSRTSGGAAASIRYEQPGNFFGNSFLAAVRYDVFSDLPASPSGLIGSSLSFSDISLTMKTLISYNYRLPSFNEMYYLNYGTASLKPEKSLTYNLSFGYNDEKFNAELNGFMINTNDQIVAVPKSPLVWSARNMASVLSRGLELTVSAKFFDNILLLGFNYTLQKATDNEPVSPTYKKIVQYVPQELANVFVRMSYLGYSLDASLRYNGFTFSLPDNSYESLVRSFYVFDLNLQKQIEAGKLKFILKAAVLNLFDKRYYVIKNYPMPGRILRAGLDFEL